MSRTLPRDIEAEITFLPIEHGGRKSGSFNGYRGQFYYDGQDWDAPHEYPDVDTVPPGGKVRAYLGFVSPEAHFGRIYPGMAFLVREGNRIVGYGSVTKLMELEQSAMAANKRGRRDA